VAQSALVEPAPGDTEGGTGSVGHTVTFSALQDGKLVSVSSVAVIQIGWDEKLQRRQCVMESFVHKIDVI
jgi:hypothetical protein